MRHMSLRLALLSWSVVLLVNLMVICLALSSEVKWLIAIAFGISILTVATSRAFAKINPAPTGSDGKGNLSSASTLLLIVVTGPHARALFSDSGTSEMIRQSVSAVWLYAETPTQLQTAVTSALVRHGRLPDAVLLPVLSDYHPDDGTLRGEFAEWQRALSAIASDFCIELTDAHDSESFVPRSASNGVSGQSVSALPCYVAIYAKLAGQRGLYASHSATWIGQNCDTGTTPTDRHDFRQSVQQIKRLLVHRDLSSIAAVDARRNTLAQALLEWLNETAITTTLTKLTCTAPLFPAGVWLADVERTPARSGAWSRWLTKKTGLQPVLAKSFVEPFPLPDFLPLASTLEKRRYPENVMPVWQGLFYAAWLGMLALCVAFALSAWNNYQFARDLTNKLNVYWNTPAGLPDARHNAIQVLIQKQEKLHLLLQNGVPYKMRWGFFQGAHFVSLIDTAIANYKNTEPIILTFNSVLLFDTGNAVLKEGAAPLLHQALAWLAKNPKKNVLISGHTDNIGNPESNVRLSEARARAVRLWLVKTSAFPITHFAIQGFGDTRPLTGNTSDAERASNRRVDITLVPDYVGARAS
ncbi:OmpA family protein [Glaciimonas immobilis]|uniref:Outer membrane protein OmpA-like peptidoglycan-associated protein n=1 Tax=Glaciimonas immobilis TaxID=728004 RepID=A0A840RR96_9BURK|nr:OmpA family protein [Glaciimonas immobilis]KAF3998066.1 OmpA family protein [Glaciimonas immobilis]MBB5199244.1 outer membrane protein OmpA-like peptidoglycan-associated protein [Glaciimonas immobilis]